MQLEGELDAMELPEVSPYTEAYLGYELTRGHYDHRFKLHIQDNKIDLDNTLHMRQLQLEPVDPDAPQPIEQSLDVPLNLALDMLRDSDDNIKLEVPIQGRLDQPDIRIDEIINNALAKALKKGATSYLKFALQPYGAILMAADFVGEQVGAIRLEPLAFEPGSDAVPEQTDYLDKLQELLQERPQLHLSLCGRSSRQDRMALFGEPTPQAGEQQADQQQEEKLSGEQKTALLDLAERRGQQLKRLFVERGVAGKRLLLCRAEYEPEGVAGVQLGM